MHKKILKLLKNFNLTFQKLEQGQLCWNGDGVIRSNTNSNILHEIAHYQVADPSRRQLPNYGLGKCPDEYEIVCQATIQRNESQNEEELASALGILWEKKYKLNWESTLVEHGWNDNFGGMSFKTACEELRKRGYVSKRYVPYDRLINK